METWTSILYVLVAAVSIALICLVLIQPSKSGGFSAGGASMGESVFGAYAGSHLTKLTVIFTTVLFVLTLLLAALVGRAHQTDSLAEGAAAVAAQGDTASASETVVVENIDEAVKTESSVE
jgi:preprotein translocase subunit SecG